MAMGSTGTVNVTPDMIKSALSAIEESGKAHPPGRTA